MPSRSSTLNSPFPGSAIRDVEPREVLTPKLADLGVLLMSSHVETVERPDTPE